MPVLGITGGIGTGKSSVTEILAGQLGAEVFDADAEAHRLIAGDAAVREGIQGLLGAGVFGGNPAEERRRIRDRVFGNADLRRELEGILHPRIRLAWQVRAEEVRAKGGWLCVDIPLLFETGAEALFDRTIVVACSAEVQRSRLRELRGLSEGLADKIIASQADLRLKIRAADHVIWNDWTLAVAGSQCELLSACLKACYG